MATKKIRYRDLDPSLIDELCKGLGYDDTDIRNQIKYLRDAFDEWLKKPPVEVMKGATASKDGVQGMAPTPRKGQQDNVLTGDAGWTPQSAIKAGRAIADKDGRVITSYINNASFDRKTRTLIFNKGDGTKIDVPLVEDD